MVRYKHKSYDTRTRERENGHPVASATGPLGDHEKKGVQSVGAAFVPHIN